jgi:hypothetical protein
MDVLRLMFSPFKYLYKAIDEAAAQHLSILFTVAFLTH